MRPRPDPNPGSLRSNSWVFRLRAYQTRRTSSTKPEFEAQAAGRVRIKVSRSGLIVEARKRLLDAVTETRSECDE